VQTLRASVSIFLFLHQSTSPSLAANGSEGQAKKQEKPETRSSSHANVNATTVIHHPSSIIHELLHTSPPACRSLARSATRRAC